MVSRWVMYVEMEKQERLVLGRFATKLQRRLEHSMVTRWRVFADTERASKALLTRIINRMICSYLGRGFRHWLRQLNAVGEAAQAERENAVKVRRRRRTPPFPTAQRP